MPSLIRGRVIAPDGGPVRAARVMFRSAPGSVPDVAGLTSESGDFILSAPEPGHYEIELAADEYAPAVVGVDAPAAGEVSVEVRLPADGC